MWNAKTKLVVVNADLCLDINMGVITEIEKALAAKLLTVEKHNNKELTESRLATCGGCPNFDPEKKKCKVCGCFMEVKSELLKHRNPKALGRIELTHCPDGKWADKETANFYRKLDNKELLK